MNLSKFQTHPSFHVIDEGGLRIKLIMRKFEFEADVSFHVVSEEVWV
jgi:hypothetical protein